MTAAELAALYARRAARVDQEFARTAREMQQRGQTFVDNALRIQIYSKPEDVSPTGRPKWRRTGRLAAQEKVKVTDPYTVTFINDAPYAVPRHEAGKPGARKINPARVSHWRDDLVATFQRSAGNYWRSAVERILRAG